MKRLIAVLAFLIPSLVTAQGATTNPLTRAKVNAGDFTPTGTWDFDTGILRVDRGTCPPDPNGCDASGEVGQIYICTDTNQVFKCSASASGWEAVGGRASSNVLTVCPTAGECDYSVICGATCTSPLSSCAAGSALNAAYAIDGDPNAWVTIEMGPGRYDECVTVNDASYIAFVGQGNATLIRPTVTSAADVEGGVFRVGVDPNTPATNIYLANFAVQNDAFSAPESAIQLGEETCDTSGSAFDEVTIENVLAIGNHDCLQWCGTLDPNTETSSPPKVTIINSHGIGGSDCLVDKGYNRVDIVGGLFESISNFCESTDATALATVAGTCSAGSTTTCTIDPNDDPGTNDFFNNRKITFSGVGCAATDNHWTTDFVSSTDVLTFAPADSGGAVDPNCDYSIQGVYAAFGLDATDGISCTDVDWSTIAGSSSKSNQRLWKKTAFHVGTLGNATDGAPDTSYIRMTDTALRVVINDGWIPDNATSGCGAASVQKYAAGALLGYTAARERIILNNVSVDMEINYDGQDIIDPNCPNIIGVGISGDSAVDDYAEFTGTININNRSDLDGIVAGIAADPNRSATLRVPWAHVSIDNDPNFTGTSAHLWQALSGALQLGDITCGEACSTQGTMSLLSGASFTATATLDFGAITAPACQALTMVVPGAAAGDSCYVGPPTATDPNGSQWTCQVTDDPNDIITVNKCCFGDCADQASATFSATVRRP